MKQQFLQNSLPLLVVIRANERIEEVKFVPHPEGFACEIQGEPTRAFRQTLVTYFENYLSGKPLSLPPLDWKGTTPFTRSVLQRLERIPLGETRSYQEIAREVGIPKGARAIGGACGRNPFPFFIPCHRVVATQGIGGFSCGLSFKNELLAFEAGLKN